MDTARNFVMLNDRGELVPASQEFINAQALGFLQGLEAGQCENTEELEALREMVRIVRAWLERAPILEITATPGIPANDDES